MTAQANKSKLLDKIKKNTTIKESSILSDSKFFNSKDTIKTPIPIINVAFSGEFDGGFSPGITTWAGPSKHFKTAFSLLMAKSYQDKYPESVVLFYDSEFGTPQSYFKSFGIDMDRVVHTPIKNIEELKFDIMQQLEDIERGDKLIIVIDSIGNLASKKEVDDALDAKSAADMSRAKQLKSLFRMVTPHLMLKDIPLVVINHTYKCGTETMMVKTPTGSVSLKDLKVGDEVFTTNGIEQVSFTTHYENAFVTDIELENGEVLSFTSGHRFRVNGEWVFVEDLDVGMNLDSRKPNSETIKSIKHNVRKADVYDIETPTHDYILDNGVISHNTMELYAKDVVGGGTGSVYSSDNIFILGRQQEKDGTELAGYNFIINVEKSRYVKEKSKIPVTVSFDSGISKWSGLLDLALESGHVVKPSNGWYSKVDRETGEIEAKKYRIKDTDTKDFWEPLLQEQSFKDFVLKKYKISYGDIIQTEDISEYFETAEDA